MYKYELIHVQHSRLFAQGYRTLHSLKLYSLQKVIYVTPHTV